MGGLESLMPGSKANALKQANERVFLAKERLDAARTEQMVRAGMGPATTPEEAQSRKEADDALALDILNLKTLVDLAETNAATVDGDINRSKH